MLKSIACILIIIPVIALIGFYVHMVVDVIRKREWGWLMIFVLGLMFVVGMFLFTLV